MAKQRTHTHTRTQSPWPDFVRIIGKRSRRVTALYVSLNLSSSEVIETKALTREYEDDGRVYRRLDGEYYAWLCGGMDCVTRAHHAGDVDHALYIEILTKFNAVRWWAETHIGKKILDDAMRTFNPREYVGPGVPIGRTRSLIGVSMGKD